MEFGGHWCGESTGEDPFQLEGDPSRGKRVDGACQDVERGPWIQQHTRGTRMVGGVFWESNFFEGGERWQ